MLLNLITPPAAEPVILSDIEGQCRIGSLTEDEPTIDRFIAAIRQRAEAATRRALITQTYELVLDGFPLSRNRITLPLPPLQSVTSITYIDGNGDEQTLSSSAYRVVSSLSPTCPPGYIVPVYGTVWPTALDDVATVTIRFVCGYGADGGTVPQAINQWICLNVANLYENRETETVAAGRLTQVDLSTLADSLIEDYRVRGW